MNTTQPKAIIKDKAIVPSIPKELLMALFGSESIKITGFEHGITPGFTIIKK